MHTVGLRSPCRFRPHWLPRIAALAGHGCDGWGWEMKWMAKWQFTTPFAGGSGTCHPGQAPGTRVTFPGATGRLYAQPDQGSSSSLDRRTHRQGMTRSLRPDSRAVSRRAIRKLVSSATCGSLIKAGIGRLALTPKERGFTGVSGLWIGSGASKEARRRRSSLSLYPVSDCEAGSGIELHGAVCRPFGDGGGIG